MLSGVLWCYRRNVSNWKDLEALRVRYSPEHSDFQWSIWRIRFPANLFESTSLVQGAKNMNLAIFFILQIVETFFHGINLKQKLSSSCWSCVEVTSAVNLSAPAALAAVTDLVEGWLLKE